MHIPDMQEQKFVGGLTGMDRYIPIKDILTKQFIHCLVMTVFSGNSMIPSIHGHSLADKNSPAI